MLTLSKTTDEGVAADRSTRRAAVWALLQDGRWHGTMEINAVEVGGSEGCRRLRELRREVVKGKRVALLVQEPGEVEGRVRVRRLVVAGRVATLPGLAVGRFLEEVGR